MRYALPIVPLVCVACRAGRRRRPGGLRRWSRCRSSCAALLVAVPGGLAYGGEPHPAFRAIGDALRRAGGEPPAATYAHYALWRPLQVVDAHGRCVVVPPRHHLEWLGLVDYWRGGGREPVWFLADPRRTDLALIDPQRADRRRPLRLARGEPSGVERHAPDRRGLVSHSGARMVCRRGMVADAGDRRPGACDGEGPRPAADRGVGAAPRRADAPDGRRAAPRRSRRPGRRDRAGGRRPRARPLDADASTSATCCGSSTCPAGLPGEGDYATLTVSSRSAGGDRRRAPVAVRQFDVQDADAVDLRIRRGVARARVRQRHAAGCGGGAATARCCALHGPPQAVRLTLRGESPLRYFDAPPTVTRQCGGRHGRAVSSVRRFRVERQPCRPTLIAKAGGAIAIAHGSRLSSRAWRRARPTRGGSDFACSTYACDPVSP